MSRFLPLLLLLACSKRGDPGAIEITGYLDASRISATSAEDPSVVPVGFAVVGAPGAVTDLDQVTVINRGTGEELEAAVAADGSFAAQIDALVGDGLSVNGEGRTQGVSLAVADHPAFPDHVSVIPHAPDPDGLVQITLELSAPHPDLDFLLANPHQSESIWLTAAGTADLHWAGAVHGAVGDTLWLHALSPNHEPTRALQLVVPSI